MNAEQKLCIWKFDLDIDDEIAVKMPRGAKLLHVGDQRGKAVLWAMVDTNAEDCVRRIAVRGTGHPCDGPLFSAPYIGTVSLFEARLVFHMFDRGEATS